MPELTIQSPFGALTLREADGRITATLIADITSGQIQPVWDALSTGRFKTHWVEKVPGGVAGSMRLPFDTPRD